jgi:hypothetical protein
MLNSLVALVGHLPCHQGRQSPVGGHRMDGLMPVVLASGVGVMLMASCGDDRADGSSGDVVPFSEEVTYDLDDPELPRIPEESPIYGLNLSLEDVPAAVSLDDDLVFTVVLSNPHGDEDIRLDPCPVYYMAFGESSVSVAPQRLIQLDCGAVPVVPAGESRAFEMRIEGLEVAGMELDPSTIWWSIRNAGDLAVQSDWVQVVE